MDTYINKKELIKDVSDLTKIHEVQVDYIVEAFLSVVKKRVRDGEPVRLPGLCRFELKEYNQKRISRLTGNLIRPHKTLKVYPNTQFADEIKRLTYVQGDLDTLFD
jgi:nucleoid DNA-binding protein